ncbi:MAG TPA: LacI family DNA-binding transcriptional regulator [Desulfobacterales bacterium]|nr:LacI family DNA-binding transcriptional regulator [Desulfobacterales bacterium]
MTTIKDVAREAGVAMSTVSYALNGTAVISEQTRARVVKAAERLGYHRRSSRKPTGEVAAIPLIAILLPGGPGEPPLDYHYLAETLRGATETAEDFGFLVTVLYEKVKNPQFDFAGLCRARNVRGILVPTPKIHDAIVNGLMAEGYPIVLCQGAPASTPGMPTVGIDDEQGGFRATEHLVILEHTRIAMLLPGPVEIQFSAARLAGYRRALQTYGIPFDESLVADGGLLEDVAARAMESLLELPDPPTAVFAGNDTQAIGAMKAARGRGLDIPGDLAVIGFDDTTAAHQSVPPLTTMRYPDYRIASEASRMLIRKILRPEIEPESIVIPVELVIRESCGVRSTPRPRVGPPSAP